MIRLSILSVLVALALSGCAEKDDKTSRSSETGSGLAAKMKSLEENWSPGSRVSEKSRGPLIVFQAHDNEIAVDWAFEVNMENIDKSIRRFLVDIVLLNNSYEEIEFEEENRPLFTFKIKNPLLDVIKEFASIQKTAPMLPGERITCMINWDGRDIDGMYAMPGKYQFVTEVARLKGHSKLKISRDFKIVEAGPEVEVILSEQQIMHRNMEELNRINQSLFGN